MKKSKILLGIVLMVVLLSPLVAQGQTDDAKSGKVTLRIAYNWTGSDPQAPYFEEC